MISRNLQLRGLSGRFTASTVSVRRRSHFRNGNSRRGGQEGLVSRPLSKAAHEADSRMAALRHAAAQDALKNVPDGSNSVGYMYRTPYEDLISNRVNAIRTVRAVEKLSGSSGTPPNLRKGLAPVPTPEEPPLWLKPPVDVEVPRLAHGLRNILTSPGVHPLRDVHSHEFFFDPFLERVHQPDEIDFDRIAPFVTSSQDPQLAEIAQQNNCTFTGSTSSMTSVLAQIYFLFSNFKPTTTLALSKFFQKEKDTFTPSTLKPAIVYVRPRDKTYSIDSDPGFLPPTNGILLDLGKSLERLLTASPSEFEQEVLKVYTSKLPKPPKTGFVDRMSDAYSFMCYHGFCVRAQLDCEDELTPDVHKVFDLKTRATYKVRYDCGNYREHLDYKISRLRGRKYSYEKEYYDMIRSVFLKYGFQARIGRMGGVMVTYHNTDKIFGFEYVSLAEMDTSVYGTPYMGKVAFEECFKIARVALDRVVKDIPGKTLKVALAARRNRRMDIYIEEIDDDRGWSDPFERTHESLKNLKKHVKQIFAVNHRVHKYSIALDVLLNDVVQGSPFDFLPEDRVDTMMKMDCVGHSEDVPSIIKEYQKVLFQAEMAELKGLSLNLIR